MDSEIRVKTGLAEMLRNGVIMDVTNAEQALMAFGGRTILPGFISPRGCGQRNRYGQCDGKS